MKHPVLRRGKYTIDYIQIPYVDRYFIVKYERVEICHFPKHLWEKEGDRIFWFLEGRGLPDKFVGKVEEYNKYLDKA